MAARRALFADLFLLDPYSFNGWSVFLPHKWHWATFVTSYVGIPLFAAALCIGRYISGRGLVRCCFMDFTSGLCLLKEQESECRFRHFVMQTTAIADEMLHSGRAGEKILAAKIADLSRLISHDLAKGNRENKGLASLKRRRPLFVIVEKQREQWPQRERNFTCSRPLFFLCPFGTLIDANGLGSRQQHKGSPTQRGALPV